jgi:hypothetical protein
VVEVGENPVESEDQDHRNEMRHQVFKRNQYDRHLMQVSLMCCTVVYVSKWFDCTVVLYPVSQ